jgi:DNA-binding MarR family transcriptional regulator
MSRFIAVRSEANGYRLAYLVAALNRRMETEIEERLRPEGVAIEPFRVLGFLAAKDGQPMGELATHVLVDSPTLTKIVDRMVASALVYRAPDPNDRRRVLIFLSDKGRRLHARLAALVSAGGGVLVEGLPDPDAAALEAILGRLIPSS